MEKAGSGGQFDDFAVTFSQWLVNEMQYGGPVSSELLSRIAHSRVSPVFKFLVSKIRSKRAVETILGNLMLNSTETRSKSARLQLCTLGSSSSSSSTSGNASSMSSSERHKLIVKRERLLQQLAGLKSANQQLTLDLAVARNSLLEKEQDLSTKREHIGDCRHQTCLLEQQSLTCGQHLHSLIDKSQQLRTTLDQHREKATVGLPSNYSARDGGRLESNVMQQTRAIVEQTKVFLSRHYLSKEEKRAREEGDKQAIWSGMEVLVDKLPAHTVLTSLRQLAKEHAQHVGQQTQKIDLAADARKLRQQGEDSSSLSLINTLQSLIQTSQLQHIEQFTITQQLQARTRGEHQRLQDLLRHYQKLQQKCFSSQLHVMAMARSATTAEAECEGLRFELAQWKLSVKQNKEKCTQRQQERVDLITGHQQISSFSATVDDNQSFIAALVKYNSNAFDRLGEQQGKVRQYVERAVAIRQSDISSSCLTLRDHVLQSSRTLASLPLDRLLVTPSEQLLWAPVCDSSIHRHGNAKTAGASHVPRVLHSLHFPSYKVTDNLLQHVWDSLEVTQSSEQLLFTLKLAHQRAEAKRSALEHVHDHLALSAAQEKRDRTQLIPQLSTMCRRCTDSLGKCVHVQQLVEEWWEQPAQFLVPWHTHRDLNLQQWTEQFVVLATKWHQQQLLK